MDFFFFFRFHEFFDILDFVSNSFTWNYPKIRLSRSLFFAPLKIKDPNGLIRKFWVGRGLFLIFLRESRARGRCHEESNFVSICWLIGLREFRVRPKMRKLKLSVTTNRINLRKWSPDKHQSSVFIPAPKITFYGCRVGIPRVDLTQRTIKMTDYHLYG